MKELLEKISSYNLFNYLLPGILLVVASDAWTKYNFVVDNIMLGAFVYYFIGMVVSRFGSLVIEPILKKVTFLNFSKYSEFVGVSNEDNKLEVLSEANNTYRTIVAMLVLLIGLKVYGWLEGKFVVFAEWNLLILILLLLVMFLFAYRKQTEYITKRIKAKNK